MQNRLQFKLEALWFDWETAFLRADSAPKAPLNSNPKWGSMPQEFRRNTVQLNIPSKIDLKTTLL